MQKGLTIATVIKSLATREIVWPGHFLAGFKKNLSMPLLVHSIGACISGLHVAVLGRTTRSYMSAAVETASKLLSATSAAATAL